MRQTKTKKSTSKTALRAVSKKTGIEHTFNDVQLWERLAKEFLEKSHLRQQDQLLKALALSNWFSKLGAFEQKASLPWQAPVYRVTHGWAANNIAGTLADGGRFNIGGAQQTSVLSGYTKCSGLYCATTIECALSEVAKPVGYHRKFMMTPRRQFLLWDLTAVLKSLPYPSLAAEVTNSPVDAIWGYQKIPLSSQLLGHFLKSKGGNGILFPSTKQSDGVNIFFFFDTDADVSAAFDVLEIK